MNSHENKKLHLIHSTYYFCLVKKTTVWSVNDKADRSWMSSIYILGYLHLYDWDQPRVLRLQQAEIFG